VPHYCHCTARRCAGCGRRLKDSIIHFGESLPPKALTDGFANAKAADICIVLGSSLTVSPASDMPRLCGERKGAKLIIVNLQETPLDSKAAVVVHARTDQFMAMLLSELRMEIANGDAFLGGQN